MTIVVFQVKLTDKTGAYIADQRVAVPFKRGHVEAAVKKAQADFGGKSFASECVKLCDYDA